MSNIDNILNSLDKVKSLGGGRYKALCPVHDEKTPSLGITQKDDDRIIMHCFGCGANGVEIIRSLGMELADLFPESERRKDDYRRDRKPFPATQILECINFESSVIMIAARQIIDDVQLNRTDYQRVETAYNRIYEAVNYGK